MIVSSLFQCEVGHVRVKPLRHALRMQIFYLWLDLDDLNKKKWRLFSYNRFNLFSVNDRRWGKRDGTSVADHIRELAGATAGAGSARRIFMLCLPAVLGRVFNPITSYYCFDDQDQLTCLVFEVSNTFGQHHLYAVRADQLENSTAKILHVSPFNVVEGYYHFKAPVPDLNLHLGVQLFTQDTLTLNTWVNGKQQSLTDFNLLKAFLRMPLLPLQVLAAIHWEAFKIWRKGLKVNTTPPSPTQAISVSPHFQQGHTP